MIRTIHRAQYVLAEADLLLQNAAVHVSDPGRISRVEPWMGVPSHVEADVIDWGRAVVLPGLVNAHCHLELTDLHGRVGAAAGFTGWLAQLVRLRRSMEEREIRGSVVRGAELSLAAGTTLLGDISASGVSWDALGNTRLRRVVFEEVLGLSASRVPEVIARLQPRLEADPDDRIAVRGISPHAPYSVSAELYQAVVALSRERVRPIATHAAETREEAEFLRSGSGPLREFLSELGALPDGWTPPGREPLPYLEQLGTLAAAPLLVHCNYLDDADLQRILAHRASVAYCPRSHAFFGHEPHPVRRLLDAGVNVALGTDSLASNDSLSMLDEMRFLHRSRPDLRVEEIFRMATLNGAAALGFGGLAGRLRRGYWADLTILELPASVRNRNLARQILEGAGECVATVVGGVTAWSRQSREPMPVRGL